MITGRQSSRDTILSAVFDDFFPDLASTASFWTCDRLLHFYKWTSTWMSFRKANPWNKWVCLHFEKNRSVQSSTWAHPSLLSFAQGKGHNLCSTAPIWLAADKTPLLAGAHCSVRWQFNPVEQGKLSGWCTELVVHFQRSGEGRGKGKGEEQKKSSWPAFPTSLYSLSTAAYP